ncbi:hypothetical protein HY605_03720 [Candidatus Peregrinibacteria bacterium]|nr:hypothetical protein [Candidatus Peregrinibacteria bacterium]
MKKTRAYIDTSVFGGCFDEEFSEASNKVIELLHTGKWVAIVSDIVATELDKAPQNVKDAYANLPDDAVEDVELDEEAEVLAEEYIKANVITRASINDAYHVAMATCARADVILSWNFKDIVNLTRIRGFNSINIRMGYHEIEIRSPLEVKYEEEKGV